MNLKIQVMCFLALSLTALAACQTTPSTPKDEREPASQLMVDKSVLLRVQSDAKSYNLSGYGTTVCTTQKGELVLGGISDDKGGFQVIWYSEGGTASKAKMLTFKAKYPIRTYTFSVNTLADQATLVLPDNHTGDGSIQFGSGPHYDLVCKLFY